MSPRFFIHQNYEPAKEETRGKKTNKTMKKVFFSLLIAACAGIGMTSCTSKNYCYEVQKEWEEWNSETQSWEKQSSTYYMYCTPRCISAYSRECRSDAKYENRRKYKIKHQKLNKSESDCEALNSDYSHMWD